MALKRKCSSVQVYDAHLNTPPTSGTRAAKNHQPVSVAEEKEMSVRKRRRVDSLEKLPSLRLSERRDISSQGQKVKDEATSPKYEDEMERTTCIIGLKRKRSSGSTRVHDSHQSTKSPTSSNSEAENHQPVSAGEANEMPMRKKKRMDSFAKFHSVCLSEWSHSSGLNHTVEDQATAPKYERQAEDQNSLQHHVLQKVLSSGFEVLPPADKQGQSLPAPVHQSPVNPESGHNNKVDVRAEDDILSRYEIGKLLGEGGYGSVYEGKRLEDGLEVAVKIARKPKNMKYINIPGHPKPLPAEVALLILVNKGPKVPQIIQLLDWQDQPERYIMILERPSPCKDLQDFSEVCGGALDENIARFVVAQATAAADICCSRGVFHRDIKLENLLINTETFKVKLIDFGCGDLLQESGYSRFCGTLDYCPPEYYMEGKYHGRPATVWSLGVLLFRLVCGRFPKARDMEMINDDFWWEPGLSKECCHLIQSLLQQDPSQRLDLGEIIFHKWFKVTK